MSQVPRSEAKAPRQPKFTMMLDPVTRAYQKRIKYENDVAFSDFIRACVERVSSDPGLENEVMAIAGGVVLEEAEGTQLDQAGSDDSTDVSGTGFWVESEESA